MQLLYESKYQILLHSEKDRMLISDWKPATLMLDDETYILEIHKLFSFFRRLRPLRYFCDVSNQNKNLSLEAQQFSANLFKNDKARYSAIVTDKLDIKPSVEGIINELELISENFTNRYFQDKTLAMNWLLSCGNEPIILKNSQATANQS